MDLLDYFDAYARDYRAYKGGRWCYEDGLLYLALVRLHRTTGEARWLAHLRRLVDAQVTPDGTIRDYKAHEYNIDNILAGRCLFHLADTTGDARYEAAADLLAGQLASHPRIPAGNYWHKQRYPNQVWLDGLYMGLPFQVEYGLRRGNDALVQDALSQVETALAFTKGPAGLYIHGYDDARQQPWADPETGLSPAVWARAVGWLAMALVDLVDLIPNDPRAPRDAARDLLEAVIAHQRPSGLWHQVMCMPDLKGNYEESSASAMFAYAILKGARLGLIPDASDGHRAMTALEAKLAPVDGRLQLTDICCVAGLGGFDGVYRDGTPEYYVSERIQPDDIKGVGPFAYALTERLRASALA
ncbi:glycoside hydrolase family 88/105 protein [Donghicola mangrovi]|uniref:Di-trans,poly-cis-decaprenylcistransferase n=1 Tax=Donghicola mangrovi TaxID=2729614 RepID=A0A850QEG2_9RHOB|nr:glycoside hydrolase family 88 protein [Donghicola mangrovi]NVO25320.1 di-trans,poly-cis-decaprenylcistransferase [Donghicola mangrovi]